MPRDPRALLSDARDAGLLIEQFVQGRSLTQYQRDPLLRSAVERPLEQPVQEVAG